MYKVSIVMPTYNAERYLREAVDSILTQTLTDFELLVIDDNSTDKTRAILNSYQDPRIKVIDGPCRGIAAALNVGLDCAVGTYIARMDADDISMPRRLEKQVRFLDIHPEVGLCGTLAMMFTKNGDYQLFGNKQLEQMGVIDQLYDAVVCHPTVMFRRELFQRYDLRYNEDFETAEDQELWSRALRYTKFYGIQEMLLRYRVHPRSASQAKAGEGEASLEKIRRELLDWLLPSGFYEGNLKPKIEELFSVLERRPEKKAIEKKILMPNIAPAFSKESVSIVTCSSEEYARYCGVMLQSILFNASEDENYDIVVLTQNMSGESKAALELFAEGKDNVSIRFCYVNELLEQYTFNEKEHIPNITCSRLLIPEIFEDYNKVVWIDVDAVTNEDIAKLYHMELGDNLIAAAHDIGMAGGDGEQEMFDMLGMGRNDYVNTGVLVMNCEQLRQEWTSEQLLAIAARPDFDNMDQDALNFCCKGRIKYLDMRWNVNATNVNSSRATAFLAEQYRQAVNTPCIVHYIGPVKPWSVLTMPMSRYFWKYAAQTRDCNAILQQVLDVYRGTVTHIDCTEAAPNFSAPQFETLTNDILCGKQWKRVIVWALYDRRALKEKAKKKLEGHRALYVVAKCGYSFLRGIHNVIIGKH